MNIRPIWLAIILVGLLPVPAVALDATPSQSAITTLKDILAGSCDVKKDHGAKGDNFTDDTIAIQNAVKDSACSQVYLPNGNYITSATIQVPPSKTIFANDRTSATIKYNGAGSAIQLVNCAPVPCISTKNGSGYGRVLIFNLGIVGTSAATKAGIEILAGGFSYWDIDHVFISGTFKYGIVCDQCELLHVHRSIIQNGDGVANSANIWITNGAEWTAGSAPGFSNVITIQDNQFNAAASAIFDDGGNTHNIVYNNVNGQSSTAFRIAGTLGLVMIGNAFETRINTSTETVLLTDAGAVGRAPKGANIGGLIQSNIFAAGLVAGSSVQLRFAANVASNFHTSFTVTSNTFYSVLGRSAAIDLTQASRSRFCNNEDQGTVSVSHYTGNHNDAHGNTTCPPGGSTRSQGDYVLTGGAPGHVILAPVMDSGKIGVGIANNTPAYSLDIHGTNPNIGLTNGVRGEGIGPVYLTLLNGGGNGFLGQENSAGNGLFRSGGAPYALAILASGTISPVQIGTNGTVRITVSGDGITGIGTQQTTGASTKDVVMSNGAGLLWENNALKGTIKAFSVSGATNMTTVRSGTTNAASIVLSTQQVRHPLTVGGTPATCSASCGAAVPAVIGSDSAMTVQMGSSGTPATPFIITFGGTWAAAPACSVTLATTGSTAIVQAVATTTTTVGVTTAAAPGVNDKFSVICLGTK